MEKQSKRIEASKIYHEVACIAQPDFAVQALERGDFDAFEAYMDVSTRLLDAPTTLKLDAITQSGKWFNISLIKQAHIKDDIPVILTLFWSRQRLMDEIQHRENQIESTRQRAVDPLDAQKLKLEKLRDSGITYQNQYVSWVDLVQKLSVQLGRVWTTLKDIQDEIHSDVAFNTDVIVGIQWPELLKNAQEVLSLLNVDPHINISAVLGDGGTTAKRAAVLAVEALFALKAPGGEDNDAGAFQGQVEDPMQFAIQAHPVVATLLADGPDDTHPFFNNVKAIMVLPHVQTLKAYDNTLGSFSLHSGIAETVAAYVQTFGSIFKALNRIGPAASIQSRRIKRLEDKGIRWATFYTGTRQATINASRYVGTTNDSLEKSYREVQTLFQKIKDSLNVFKLKINATLAGKFCAVNNLHSSKGNLMDQPPATWLDIPLIPLRTHEGQLSVKIPFATLMALFALTNARRVNSNSSASGYQSSYPSYCKQWSIAWPIGKPSVVQLSPHNSHTAKGDVYPTAFPTRVEKCVEMMAGIISDGEWKITFSGRAKYDINWVLEERVRGFSSAHRS
ncbi:hypothetical protein P154DRAFT_536435 [Amniculicola lignicola CBS 123094]|uniref:Uncharacterized protein n=1 Tax=Amniculicola lignicola CBS 123094 TaxID=1392246 RepID=A0A6A5WBC7_9PLEO|nr:hypothetical protein P154DRAFT_536435 [Amniculicola lignicola CBS 123094]